MNPHTSGSVWLFHSVAYYDQRSYRVYIRMKCVRMKPVAVVEHTQSARAVVSVLRSNLYRWRANMSCENVSVRFSLLLFGLLFADGAHAHSHTAHVNLEAYGQHSTAYYYGVFITFYTLHFQLHSSRMRIFFTFLFTQIERRGNCDNNNNNTTNKTKPKHLSLFY